jgi:glutamate-ammonia-ligase adenylyltransferase
VTNLESFRRYQLREGDNAAWVWEHQALTRARYCAGDQRIGGDFEKIREAVLAQQRDAQTLKQEIRSMRLKVSEGHPNETDSFDVKHDSGGMVDIEFVVQYLVLQHSGRYSTLLGNWGNIALLKRAAEVDLISKDLAEQVANAYRLYREYQHRARLDGAEKTRIAPADMTEAVQEARHAVQLLWHAVLET